MMSTEVGFYMQLKGQLTKKHYKCATIFVHHLSCMRFVHLQIDDSSAEMIAAKLAFEQYTVKHGIRILHYHYNNWQFHDNALQQACHDAQQTLTFCGVNMHF
jgi:hypothetical protein